MIGGALGAQPEVELPHVGVGEQLGRRLVHHDLAVLHDVPVVGDGQCHRGVLLDKQHRGARSR